MSLTALDPTRLPGEVVIDPIDQDGNRREAGVCRDPDCRGVMIAHRPAAHEGEVYRRAYWSHKVKPDLPNHSDSVPAHRDSKTPWHTDWQMTAHDPAMREQRVYVNGAVRIADVFTRYGWAIEFQHSTIDPKTVADRERHYGGKVLWVVDATPETGVWGSLDVYDGKLRLDTMPPWAQSVRGMLAFDDGASVRVLTVKAAGNSDMISACPMDRVLTLSHDEFVATWINADEAPFGGITTLWMIEAAESESQKAAREARRKSRDANRSGHLKAAEDDRCKYEGISRRVLPPDQPIKDVRIGHWTGAIPMCREEGCISAAGRSGWCWSHGVANDVGFDVRMGVAS